MIGPLQQVPLPAQSPAAREDARIRELCGEFEAVFAKQLLKEALKPLGADIEDSGASNHLEMARDQFAEQIGKEGLLGVGEQLYERFTNNRPEGQR